MPRAKIETYIIGVAAVLRNAVRDDYDPADVLRAAIPDDVWARAAPDRWAAVRNWPHVSATAPADGDN